MIDPLPPVLDAQSPGVTASRRSLPSYLRAILRDPLTALPDAVFHARLVHESHRGRTRLYLCDPALIHAALVDHADCLEKSDVARRVLRPALGDGLLTAEGPSWRWQRHAAAPAFQPARLRTFLPAMIQAAEATRDRWLALPPGHRVDLGHAMMRTTFAIIADTMLSGPGAMDVGRVERSISTYLAATRWAVASAILGAPEWVPYPGSRRARTAAASLRTAVEAMVVDRRASPVERPDLVALLLGAADPETGRRMDDTAITDTLLTFLTAGHETTAQALTWTLLLLSRHPDVEAAVLAEIDIVTAGGPLTPEHVGALVFLRQVLSEAMRLYPPAPILARKVVRPFTLAGGAVATGTVLIVPIVALHRHTALWATPDAFDPSRFELGRVKARHRLSYLPFGAGPRVCIGSAFATLEATAILAVLLRAVRLSPVDADMPEATMQVTLRPARPVAMRVDARTVIPTGK